MRLSVAVVVLVVSFSLVGCFEGPKGQQGPADRGRVAWTIFS
jgi:hypothetical protein